jgi:predicted dehydrogenase
MKFGCLGAANIAPTALVHPSRVVGGVVLQAVAARDPARAESFARRHGFARAEADYAAVVASADVDVIYNALPIDQHARWSIRALEAGKHVLCEKPFAMNSEEARSVLAAARASGRRVIEAFHYRYHPGFMHVLGLIQTGEIGRVTRIDAHFNIGVPDRNGAEIRHLPETGGGAFMDLGCYPLSWALMIADAPTSRIEAEATLTPRGVDETMRATLTFDGGAVAELSASMKLGVPFSARLKVTGETGEIQLVNPITPHFGASLTLRTNAESQSFAVSRLSTYAFQLAAVVRALGTGEELPTEGAAILRQQEALDGVYQAAGLRHLRFRTN